MVAEVLSGATDQQLEAFGVLPHVTASRARPRRPVDLLGEMTEGEHNDMALDRARVPLVAASQTWDAADRMRQFIAYHAERTRDRAVRGGVHAGVNVADRLVARAHDRVVSLLEEHGYRDPKARLDGARLREALA